MRGRALCIRLQSRPLKTNKKRLDKCSKDTGGLNMCHVEFLIIAPIAYVPDSPRLRIFVRAAFHLRIAMGPWQR